MATVVLSTIPDLTAAVGVARLGAIAYPQGRPFGRPGDAAGQQAVLRAGLALVDSLAAPGRVDLPFVWPDPPGRSRGAPPEPPPIAQLLKRRPWLLPRLFRREPPE